MSIYLEDLRKDYQEGKIVPFIGAGLSVPFNVPTWNDLIRTLSAKYAQGEYEFLKSAVEIDLRGNDFWGAIAMLKKYVLEEGDIQEEIARLIQKEQIKLEDDTKHNYYDLSKMDKFKFYLTTNYENLLHQYLNFDNQPILLKDILFNTQGMFEHRRVCQLHGTTSNPGTIVISRESYIELYENKKYDDLLKLVTGSKKLLFMGFSFDDQFISTLIREHKESFKGKHYILLSSPTEQKIKQLRSEYGLLTIPYNIENSYHTVEIRKILNQIAKPDIDERENLNNESTYKSPKVVIGAGLKTFKKNVEGNLFFKKLKLENIDEAVIDLSSSFYLAAEEYIRAMRKLGMPIDIIDVILGQVFLEYQERYIDTFKKYGGSEQFLNVVHESLENIDFGRYNIFLQDNKSNKNENRGFVHILADNEDENIWWGKERFDGESKK